MATSKNSCSSNMLRDRKLPAFRTRNWVPEHFWTQQWVETGVMLDAWNLEQLQYTACNIWDFHRGGKASAPLTDGKAEVVNRWRTECGGLQTFPVTCSLLVHAQELLGQQFSKMPCLSWIIERNAWCQMSSEPSLKWKLTVLGKIFCHSLFLGGEQVFSLPQSPIATMPNLKNKHSKVTSGGNNVRTLWPEKGKRAWGEGSITRETLLKITVQG